MLPGCAGMVVTDFFGSLDPLKMLAHLNQDFRDEKYAAHDKSKGAGSGLGLYGVLQSGLSLVIEVSPGKRTDAMIFFPSVTNHRAFKAGFQFSACFTSS